LYRQGFCSQGRPLAVGFLLAKNLKTLDSKSPLPVMLQTRDIKDDMQKLRIYAVFSKIKSRPTAIGLLNVKRGHVRQYVRLKRINLAT
jgi:hypothetical protein